MTNQADSAEEFTDITDDVDQLLAQPDIAHAVAGYRHERAEADRAYAMGLAAIRRAFDLTQVELSRTLGVSQPAVAKVERQSDMLVSTLCSYLRGVGGHMRVVVDFEGGQEIEVTLDALSGP